MALIHSVRLMVGSAGMAALASTGAAAVFQGSWATVPNHNQSMNVFLVLAGMVGVVVMAIASISAYVWRVV